MSSFLHSAFSNSPKYQCQAIFFSSANSGQDKPSGEKGWREQASSANKHGGHLGAWPAARVHRPEAAVRPLVGRATYLGPYNVPRTSRPSDWRLMPAVAYLLFASHPLSNRSSGRTDLPSAGWPSAGGPSGSWIGGPPSLPAAEAAQTECCSCSTAPVGLRESVGRRPPRRAHPPYSHGQDHPCKNLPACQHSLALPPAGRVVEPGGERVEPPVRSADCTSRLGPQHSRQRTAERADWRTGRRPPADCPPARCRAAVGASLHRHHNGQRAVSHITS